MTTADKKQQLLAAAALSGISLDELINTVRDLLHQIAPVQTRYTVSEVPDGRTIRYYITQGLVPKPQSYAGGRANYGGEHILSVLLIKKRQATLFSLRQIKQQLDADAQHYGANTARYQRQLIEQLLDEQDEQTDETDAAHQTPAPSVFDDSLAKQSETINAHPDAEHTVMYRINAQCTVYIAQEAFSQHQGVSDIAHALRELATQLENTSE